MYFTSITIIVPSLKQLLLLFSKQQKIRSIQLIDTAHPKTGCIDESILDKNHTIQALIQFDYDFRGLVQFEMKFDSVRIQLVADDTYEVYGQANDLKKVIDKLMKEDLHNTSPYKYTFSTNYRQ